MARAGGIDPLVALANELKAIAITLGKWFIPLYNSGLAAILAGGFFLLAILLVYRFAGIINKKYALLGALWFILFLIVPAVFKKGYNEWWSYPADIGLLLVLAQMRLRIPERKGVFVAAASIIILLAGLTLTKNRLFKDETTFADHYIRYVTNEPAAYYIRGTAYMKQSRFTDAIRDFDQVIGRRPGYPNAYYSRGLCYTNLKDYPRAIADFSRTIETDSGSVVAYYNRGFCYFYLKEYDKAYADFIHYLSDVPNNGAAYFYRGVCEFHLGGYDPALKSYQKARDFGFNVPDALFEEIRKAREQALSGQ
jgi:tetratricopeptide (TPR) repeat protein